jgi:DNA invertase Pin-like site-specific DNA recombinase
MALLSPPSQIRPTHQGRSALIYVRQSTLMQVRYHTASTQRQYDLVQRALDLGWTRDLVQVLDQDQGLSGADAVHRDGFQFLVAQVSRPT